LPVIAHAAGSALGMMRGVTFLPRPSAKWDNVFSREWNKRAK
jgi:hypothetical protein